MIDLHSHTIHSDGSSNVAQLLLEAQGKNLSKISITDHNTIGAYGDLENTEIRSLFEGEILNGVEITTTYNGEIVEVLGYDFDINMMRSLLPKQVLTFEAKQLREFELIKRKYTELDIKFDINKIIFDAKKESSRAKFYQEIMEYPENDRFFLDLKSKSTYSSFTRNEVYNPKSPLYVDQSSLYPSLESTIEIIHQTGGLAFLAHPFAYSNNISSQVERIISSYNFDGIECYYTTFTNEQIDYLLSLCEQKGLYKSGGSDFHGTNKKNHNLGTGNGNMKIEDSLIFDWHGKRDFQSKKI